MLPMFVRPSESAPSGLNAKRSVLLVVVLAALSMTAAGCAGLGIDHALTLEYTGDTRHACMARAYQTVARREARTFGRFVSAQRFLGLAHSANTSAGDPFAAPSLAHGSSLSHQHRALSAALARWPEGTCGCANAKAYFTAWQNSLADSVLDVTVPGERLEERRTRYQAEFTSALAHCQTGR